MVMLRNYAPVRARRGGVMMRGCCCAAGVAYCYQATTLVMCGATDYDDFYRPQTGDIGDAWQDYCLRGVVYRNRTLVNVDEGDNQGYFYQFELDSWNDCVARMSIRRFKEPRVPPYLSEYVFGTGPCVDLNPIIDTTSSINWRCVLAADILDPLSALIPLSIANESHDVVLTVDYKRHVQGRWSGNNFNFESGDIHAFFVSAYAIFNI